VICTGLSRSAIFAAGPLGAFDFEAAAAAGHVEGGAGAHP
jgi:hypothetical protein